MPVHALLQLLAAQVAAAVAVADRLRVQRAVDSDLTAARLWPLEQLHFWLNSNSTHCGRRVLTLHVFHVPLSQ